jgi:hypothetical protein
MKTKGQLPVKDYLNGLWSRHIHAALRKPAFRRLRKVLDADLAM